MQQSQTRVIGGVTVYVPTGVLETTVHPLAPRLRNVSGARIGILDNHKAFAGIVLRGIANPLRSWWCRIRWATGTSL